LNVSNQNIDLPQSFNHAAYVVYTSGSSGRPKGVVLTHRAATTGLLSSFPNVNLRSLLFFNPVFSAAQRTIWSTIIHGGRLCLASKESIMSDLGTVITKLAVNTIGVTTTTASLLTPDDVHQENTDSLICLNSLNLT
jgi:non-ribosomal peptide synthetase component F